MRLRIIILLIPLLLVLAAPLWWPAVAGFFRPRGGPEVTPVRGAEKRQFAMEGVRFSQSRGGKPEWRINAARLETARGRDNEMRLEEVEAVLRGESASRFHITSDQGIYDSDALVLTLMDDVLVRMRDGYELRTELLRYLEKRSKVETGAPVRLVGKDVLIHGQGMTYDLDTGSYAVGGRLDVLLK